MRSSPSDAQRRLLALRRAGAPRRRARALQRAVHRGRSSSSVSATSPRREAEHLAQDQHGALARRQVLERGDERQLDALALLVARLGRRLAVADAVALVRVRLQPDGSTSGVARPVARAGRRAPRSIGSTRLRPPRDRVQARVGRDPVQPRAERRARPNPASPRHARSSASCSASSASCDRAEHPVAVRVQLGRGAARPAGGTRPRRRARAAVHDAAVVGAHPATGSAIAPISSSPSRLIEPGATPVTRLKARANAASER